MQCSTIPICWVCFMGLLLVVDSTWVVDPLGECVVRGEGMQVHGLPCQDLADHNQNH